MLAEAARTSPFAMGQDAPAALVMECHGAALRLLCASLGAHATGLAAAARLAARQRRITPRMKKKLDVLDGAFAICRHVTRQGNAAFLEGLAAMLADCDGGHDAEALGVGQPSASTSSSSASGEDGGASGSAFLRRPAITVAPAGHTEGVPMDLPLSEDTVKKLQKRNETLASCLREVQAMTSRDFPPSEDSVMKLQKRNETLASCLREVQAMTSRGSDRAFVESGTQTLPVFESVRPWRAAKGTRADAASSAASVRETTPPPKLETQAAQAPPLEPLVLEPPAAATARPTPAGLLFELPGGRPEQVRYISFTRRPMGFRFNMKAPIVVKRVDPGSHAEELGVGVGWVLVEINGQDVRNSSIDVVCNLLDAQLRDEGDKRHVKKRS